MCFWFDLIWFCFKDWVFLCIVFRLCFVYASWNRAILAFENNKLSYLNWDKVNVQVCGGTTGVVETDVTAAVCGYVVTPRSWTSRRLRHHPAPPRRDPAAFTPAQPGRQRRRRAAPSARGWSRARTASSAAAAAAAAAAASCSGHGWPPATVAGPGRHHVSLQLAVNLRWPAVTGQRRSRHWRHARVMVEAASTADPKAVTRESFGCSGISEIN